MYTWKKGIAKWVVGKTLYLSVPFTWLVDEAEKLGEEWNGDVRIGGPGLMIPTDCEGFEPIIFHNPSATFTTRGCPNACSFCAVPKIEGEFREIKGYRPAPVICDNNLLAASWGHLERVVASLKQFPFVDFNQGLEAKRFTPKVADLFGQLKCKIRFAFDFWTREKEVKEAIDLCRSRTTKNIGIYCLIGYKDDPESARARLELIRSWGIKPSPMRFQPLDTKRKNEYVGEGWTDNELKKMMRYYSRLRWLDFIPYEDYINTKESGQLELI